MKNKSQITVDCETNMHKDVQDAVLLMFQLGDEKDQWIIDCRDYSIEPLRKYLENPKILKVGHNIKFDYKVVKVCTNIIMANVFDTMIGEYILSTGINREKGYYSLENTYVRYFNSNPYGNQLSLFDPFTPKSKRNEISKKTIEDFTYAEIFYGKTDVVSTSQVFEKQILRLLEEKLEEVAELENRFVLVLADMEINGMPINTARWLELASWSQQKLIETEESLSNQYPEVLNWNSSKQVAKQFRELGIPITVRDKTKSKEINVYKDSVQENVIKEHEDKFPIIKEYLLYKRYQKLSSTYGVGFLKYISYYTNRIHSSFIQILNTGRTSSTAPNMQNIVSEKPNFPEGKWWREVFQTEKDSTFIICDYGSQELHIVADKSQDPTMLEVLRNKGDLHRTAAAALYEKAESEITSAERKEGKITNFTIVYGGGEDKIAETFKIPRTKAKRLIQNYFEKFKKLKELQERSYAYALANGHILVDQLGRKSYIKEHAELLALKKMAEDPNCNRDIRKQYLKLSGKIFRDSSNYPIQGTAASMSKFAGVLIREESLKNKDLFKIILLIHDEWVVECLLKDSEIVKDIVERCMVKAANAFCRSVNIPADAIVSQKWNKD